MSRLDSIQSLRGLAAMMVLMGHVLAEAGHYFAVDLPATDLPWSRGVDIFFVISGFIIALSIRRFSDAPWQFLQRRLLRVAPLYFLFTTLMVVVLLTSPSAIKDTDLDLGQIISSYLFLPYERADGRIAPVLSLGWTLNYEVFFYAAMALCLALRRPLLALISAFVAMLVLAPVLLPDPAAAFYGNPLILEFVFGIGLARLWLSGRVRTSGVMAAAMLLAGLGLLITLHGSGIPRVFAAGVPAAMIVAAGALWCPERPLPFCKLGDASYALYLSHRFVLRAGTLFLLPLLPEHPASVPVFCVALVAAAIGGAILVHRYVERPLLRALSGPIAISRTAS